MYKKRILINLIIIILFFSFSCSAKNYTIKDEIKKEISYFIEDANKEFNKGDINEAIETYQKALTLAYSIDKTQYIIIIYLNLTEIYIFQEDFENSKFNLKQAAFLLKYENFPELDHKYFYLYAKYFYKMSNFSKALESVNRCYNYKASKRQTCNSYNLNGLILNNISEYEMALELFKKALKISKSKKYYDLIADNSYNIGNVYYLLKNYESALQYLLEALEADKINEYRPGILNDMLLIGRCYIKIENIDMARYYLNKALEISKRLEKKDYIKEIQRLLDSLSS